MRARCAAFREGYAAVHAATQRRARHARACGNRRELPGTREGATHHHHRARGRQKPQGWAWRGVRRDVAAAKRSEGICRPDG